VTIRKIESNELKKIGRPGLKAAEGAPPSGLAPILRASWNFARDTARRFSKELITDRTEKFLNEMAKRF
jgi:hypothetical protein